MPSTITERHQPCPSCPSSDGYCRYDDGHGYCFSCKKYFKSNQEFVLEDFTYEHLAHRGISKETYKHYDVQTKIDKDGKPVAVRFPYPDRSGKIRSLDQKEFKWDSNGDKSKTGLFGADRFDPGVHKYVTITEGEYDALSVYDVLRSPAVSVQSASSAVRDVASFRSWLEAYERVYLCFDNDGPGREAVHAVAKLLDPGKVYVVRFTTRKDANEYLQAGERDELRQIWWNAKPYVPDNIINGLDEFEAILKAKPQEGFPYPFKALTEMTYGIRTSEVVLLAAQEKVGKTSIMREILYKLLTESDHNAAAFFLEETRVRLLQGLAGRRLEQPVHLPDSGVPIERTISALRDTVGKDDRLHVYTHFGNDDPDVLLNNIRFLVVARSVKYVLFDHIGMAVSGKSKRGDERGELEYLITRLVMMAKELDFALIVVSHLNDYGQTRGSHYLTKVADITIQAIRNPLALDETDRNTIYFQIPFNRFCAKSGPAGAARLNPKTYVLEEVFDVPPANDNFPVALGKQVA